MDDIFDINQRIDGSFKPRNEAERLYLELEEIAENLDKYNDSDDDKKEMFTRDVILFQELKDCFSKLYHQSKIDNFYWDYCPFETYKANLKRRLFKFIEFSPDSPPRDFFIREIKGLCHDEELNKYIVRKDFDFESFDYLPEYFSIYYMVGNYCFTAIEDFFNITVMASQKKKIEYLIDLILSKSQIDFNELLNEPNKQLNGFQEIFINNGYKLFEYLNENYTINNNSQKAKYSFLYHFLKEDYMIGRTQQKYIEGIQEYYGVTLSKIQPANYKYKDYIRPKLSELESNFKRNSRSELN